MPVTAVPERWLSDKLAAMQRQIDELSRAAGRPSDQVRDQNDNVVQMIAGAEYPVLGAKSQDVSVALAGGVAYVTDGNGRDTRPLVASQLYGPLAGDTTGVHHGDVGSLTETHNHYGDLHGNSYGFHFGPVGDGSTQNQINAANVFANGFFGNVGIAGQNWTFYGTVVAPSECALKADVRDLTDAGDVVDAVPVYRWRWGSESHDDGHEHVGPMVDDVDDAAPWLVRRSEDTDVRSLADRDLIGILWGALREARQRIAALEQRVEPMN